MAYEFHYTPTGTGVISGKEVLEQTEDAINDLGNTAISGVQEALDKAEQALTNSENAVDDAQTALNTANNAEGVAIQAQNDVSNLSGTVTNIGNRVTTAEGNIGNLQGRMTTAEGNIGNLQGRMTTAEGNIGNLQTAVSTAQATANSAQQTATTARQQSYVFRYSSTALVASSTNSNSLLDNTDNLKVGDKVIDSSGVLFSITAIDTANSTFTIGTALIDLAQDSDVVHKSGDETIGGKKTFSENITCFSNYGAKSIICKTPLSTYDSTNTVGDNTKIRFLDKNDNSISYIMQRKLTNGSTDISLNVSNTDSNNQPIEATLTFILDSANEPRLSPGIDNTISFGRPTFRYKSFYGMNYYYGSNNVEFSTKFVTTDTNQTISGEKTFNSNTYIYNSDNTATTPYLYLKNSKTTKGSTSEIGAQLVRFVDKNNSNLCDLESIITSTGSCELRLKSNTLDSNNQNVQTGVTLISGTNGSKRFCPTGDNSVSCGYSALKWSSVYATNYYYGNDNVEFSTKFVTTDTAQTISGNKTFGNGTLIVNNSTGSNVHGEIKLQGSRSGYIVADNASDGVFDNAKCGISILLQDAGKPLHIGGYKTDSNGRVFADNTNKTPVLSITSSLVKTSSLVPENDTGNSAFRILSQLDYANGNPSKTLDVRFIQYDNADASSAIYSNNDNKTSLGTGSGRWSDVQTYKVNNLEPSSLSLPSDSGFIDIRSYFTNTGTGGENSYTASANGWIYLRLGDINSCQATIYDSNNIRMWGQSTYGSVEQMTIPILKGQTLTTLWNTSSTVNVATARFIPCQGNV